MLLGDNCVCCDFLIALSLETLAIFILLNLFIILGSHHYDFSNSPSDSFVVVGYLYDKSTSVGGCLSPQISLQYIESEPAGVLQCLYYSPPVDEKEWLLEWLQMISTVRLLTT